MRSAGPLCNKSKLIVTDSCGVTVTFKICAFTDEEYSDVVWLVAVLVNWRCIPMQADASVSLRLISVKPYRSFLLFSFLLLVPHSHVRGFHFLSWRVMRRIENLF